MRSFIFKLDHGVAEIFHKFYLWGGDFANGLMKGISFIAEAGILFLAVGLILAIFKKTRRAGATILLAVGIGFLLTNVALKNIIERARPFMDRNSDFFKWWLDAGNVSEDGFSFPSGHTTATTAFSIAVFLSFKKKYSWPILLLPIAMASSRIYLMVHYFSDCLGGIVVGAGAAGIAYLIMYFVYKSKLKFFVWATTFDIFKKDKTENVQEEKVEVKKEDGNDYEYIPQAEEKDKVENKSLIQQEIQNNEEK